MSGLSREHERQFNESNFEDKQPLLVKMRKLYHDDPLALEQIDRFDGNSPYGQHLERQEAARRNGNSKEAEKERQWIKKHYPLTET